jgi:hypothetical protein
MKQSETSARVKSVICRGMTRKYTAEMVGVEVTLKSCILEVLGSSLSRIASTPVFLGPSNQMTGYLN